VRKFSKIQCVENLKILVGQKFSTVLKLFFFYCGQGATYGAHVTGHKQRTPKPFQPGPHGHIFRHVMGKFSTSHYWNFASYFMCEHKFRINKVYSQPATLIAQVIDLQTQEQIISKGRLNFGVPNEK